MTSAETTAERLVQLGFSQYEARAYVGLLGTPPMTGYGLSNATGIPQPKVYETLRRLVTRGAVIQTGEAPARFTAVSPEQLLKRLDAEFRRRLADARDGLARLAPEGEEQVRPVHAIRNRPGVLARAAALIGQSGKHVCLSGHADDLAVLADAVREAESRDVRFRVLCVGDAPFQLERGRLLRHTTADSTAECHRIRHLALEVDDTVALWALAPDEDDWDCLWAENPLFATAIHTGVRREMSLQRIHTDFGEQIAERYGPSPA